MKMEHLLEELKNLKQENMDLKARLCLSESKEAGYKDIIDSLYEVVFELDPTGNLLFYNHRAFDFFGYDYNDPPPVNIIASVVPEDRERLKENMMKVIKGQKTNFSEYTLLRKDGTTFPAIIHSIPFSDDGQCVGIRGIIMDITERKQMDEKLKFLSLHDSLTGLYNRAYFEQELQRLCSEGHYPLGMVICDVDGLKLINDIMGHDMGDTLIKTAAGIIKSCFEGITARIGGDEFVVLTPGSSQEEIIQQTRLLKKAIAEYNDTHPELLLDMSTGFALIDETNGSPGELFRQADNNMYREKLQHHLSSENYTIKLLLWVLNKRGIIEEAHTKRLENLVAGLAQEIGLPETRIEKLVLFARFHDVGKLSIPDAILLKPDRLSSQEWIEIKRHSEIGHRIALSAPDLVPISDWILKHHEYWNGSGYPLGLSNKDIPLECRIVAIADAYEAMTSERPYRHALSQQEAIAELERCAGSQFDPYLVPLFLSLLA